MLFTKEKIGNSGGYDRIIFALRQTSLCFSTVVMPRGENVFLPKFLNNDIGIALCAVIKMLLQLLS